MTSQLARCWLILVTLFDPWVGKIPWRWERLLTPVFWPGEFCGLYSPWGQKELDTTELSHHFMANRWETMTDFILGGSKITADGDCSHEIKRCLLLGRKLMTNLDSILKSREITLPTKVHLVRAMVFPMVMYGCESWTVKKAECRRIDAFEYAI